MISALFLTMRPKQWLKNFLVFAALLFSLEFTDARAILQTVVAFVLFCAASSSVYIVNDILDRNRDRLHPVKSRRPIASGRVPPGAAWAAAATFGLGSIAAALALQLPLGGILFLYVFLNLLYSQWLKHVVIIDAMILATGFVLRAIAGAVAIHVHISFWLLICTFLLALFLGFGKRRHELVLMQDGANNHRQVLNDYSAYFLDQMIGVVTASTLIVYILYTTSSEVAGRFGTTNLVYTIPFVLYGIFRYLFLIHKKERGGDPTKTLLDDWPLLLDIVLWVAVVVAILYLARI